MGFLVSPITLLIICIAVTQLLLTIQKNLPILRLTILFCSNSFQMGKELFGFSFLVLRFSRVDGGGGTHRCDYARHRVVAFLFC